jgi:hypothetical protein
MQRLGWAVAVACLGGPAWASAGQEPPSPPPPAVVEKQPVPDPTLRPETEVTLDKGDQLAAGIGFGGPIGAAASLRILHGLGADVRESDGRVKVLCALPIPHCAQGFLFQADAGSGGGNLSLGVLWRVSGQGGASALFSWGVGFGL